MSEEKSKLPRYMQSHACDNMSIYRAKQALRSEIALESLSKEQLFSMLNDVMLDRQIYIDQGMSGMFIKETLFAKEFTTLASFAEMLERLKQSLETDRVLYRLS